ncbi:hypothetical protein ACFPM0_09500 [Pseudonocardia sulfidoxydans]|uniref:hypothetical protein n=1 Tax=Pseudonocardia sulfidoxydans TaxID=54011 RepID=UPI003619B429
MWFAVVTACVLPGPGPGALLTRMPAPATWSQRVLSVRVHGGDLGRSRRGRAGVAAGVAAAGALVRCRCTGANGILLG